MSLYLGSQPVQIASTVVRDIRIGEDLIQPSYFVEQSDEDILKDYIYTSDLSNNYRLTKYIGMEDNVVVPLINGGKQ